ncbi:pentapeptide repeat-containing protein [Amycolatopsis sp. NPDC004625]|uniref:pentapeptide repeat-containing protein n=1 Tax=Amycolatopsis sp. NPDC004625 TaxID=3154670 RepID=UPI0033B014FF
MADAHQTDPSQRSIPASVRRPPLPRWTVAVVAGVVLLIAFAVLAGLWWWVNGQVWTDPEKKTAALLDVVKVASGVAVGGGGLFALYLATRRQRTQELELEQRKWEQAHREEVQTHSVLVAEYERQHAERVADATERDAAARRVTDLYTKAAEQLGSDKAPVRLAGLYALSRLGQGNVEQRATVVNVLCAYLRMPYEPPNLAAMADLNSDDRELAAAKRARQQERVQEREVRLTAQRLLATHLRPEQDWATGASTNVEYWPGHHRIDLAGATLVAFDIIGCRLGSADFSGATFIGDTFFGKSTFNGEVRFHEATFTRYAWFNEVRFGDGAWFDNATFGEANFDEAKFACDASFSGATFTGDVRFNEATFTGNVWFLKAKFTGNTCFDGTTFADTTFFGESTFNGDVSFDDATFSRDDVSFDDATMVIPPRLATAWVRVTEDVPGSEWPAGWALAAEQNGRDGHDGLWGRLVQVTPPQNGAASCG